MFQMFPAAVRTQRGHFSCCSLQHRTCLRTLQHEEPDHPVQVDVLVLPLQEGCSPGEAAQDVIDHLRTRPAHCGKQSQHCGQLVPRSPHLLSRIIPVWRLRDRFPPIETERGEEGGQADSPLAGGEETAVTSERLSLRNPQFNVLFQGHITLFLPYHVNVFKRDNVKYRLFFVRQTLNST